MNLFGWIHNKKIGDDGESIAADYLKKLGLRVVARNWRGTHCELDIVAVCKKKRTLHIVEVKSRMSDNWEAVGQALTEQKIGALRRGAVEFKRECEKFFDYTIIFDVVVVFMNDKKPKIEYIKDINFN